jgi:NAD(P)-dependent dehydrogenase (short-subunit alcohol dehydrogenase family)
MNIAGIAVWGTVETLSHEQWRRVVDVNLMGPIHVVECFVPAIIAAGRGGTW